MPPTGASTKPGNSHSKPGSSSSKPGNSNSNPKQSFTTFASEDGPDDVVANVDAFASSLDGDVATPLSESLVVGSPPGTTETGISSNAGAASDKALTKDTDNDTVGNEALPTDTGDAASNISVDAATFTTQEANASTESKPSSSPAGVSGALIVGCIAAVVAIGAAVFVFKKKRQAAKEDPGLDMVTPHGLSVV